MSTDEYNNMFLKCQNNGLYHMFAFDLKNSKSMSDEQRYIAEKKLYTILLNVYTYLQELEKKTGQKIVLEKEKLEGEAWLNREPYFIGDAGEITIYRDSISNDDFITIFNEFKRREDFSYELHMSDGYYETNHWSEGNIKYARSYCFDLLTNMHKPKYNKLRKKRLGKIKVCNDEL